ncbi:MAG: glutathione S-transferase N-terminal domain-containing protein [Sandaracinaceae bacterium]|nr:glutathione S-transferase N-terminal domain-containing protein [Sandaracinaceae bacterium]
MELYFAPMTCSLATRIALYEAGVDATYVQVDRFTKQLAGGGDYREVHPLGLVPALRLDDGTLLTETAAILQHVAALRPERRLAPTTDAGRAQLQSWLSFVGGELHKVVFYPLFHPSSSDEVKRHACAHAALRLSHVDRHLEGREHLLDDFGVADAYLFTVLGWMVATPLSLDDYPAAKAYRRRLAERPAFARAVAQERALYA